MPIDREKLERLLEEQARKVIRKMLDELPEVNDITLEYPLLAITVFTQAIGKFRSTYHQDHGYAPCVLPK